jgi:proteasome assembly chaperone (PAC2) family protein
MSLRWDHEPVLHDPVVVAAFTGWNDAADAASDAVDWLAARYGATEFADIDEQQHVDFQAQRPRATLVDGALRDLTWPVYSLRAAATPDGEPDLVLVSGPEPNYDWRGFCGSVMDAAHRVGARTVVTLGSLLADSPHSRAPHVTGSSTDADMSDRIQLSNSRYEGPTGIIGVLHDTCRNAGFAAASLWVPVPHYVAAPPNPGAILALLHGVGRAVDLAVDTRELRVAAQAWQARVDAAVAEDDDLRTYVRTLEEQYDEEWDDTAVSVEMEELPDGDAIAEAFEEYLRDQGPSST